MKPSKAPEKIYIHRTVYLAFWAASEINITGNDVEYIRTDAFIKMACEWLRENKDKYLYNAGEKGEYIPTCSDRMIDDFKNYMKK